MYQPVSACIFDMDGVLLDTENIYTKIANQIVSRYGKTYDWTIKGNMLGRPAMDSARYLIETLDLPITPESYIEERSELAKIEFLNCSPMPGAVELVSRLHNGGVPVAVATSSYKDLFEIKTTHHKPFFDLFDVIVTGDDPEIEQGKPAPDIFLLAAKRLSVAPEESLVFEDAPTGLAAGIAAGMQVVAVPDPNMDKSRYKDATQILDSLSEFDPGMYSLAHRA